MKRFFVLGISCVLIMTLFLSSCTIGTVDREKELKDALNTVDDTLDSTFSEDEGDFQLVTDYVKSWAKGSKLDITADEKHYMVLTNPATEGCENSESVTLQCAVLTDDFNKSMETLSIGLTALLGPSQHGTITLIITEEKSGRKVGASKLPAKYVACDNFINIEYDSDNSIFTSGGKAITGNITSPITYTGTKYTHAYQINMSMRNYTDPFYFSDHYPNPVETIGSLLSSAKSSGKIFEVASFNCKATKGYTPHSASVVVVVDENNVESFLKKFENSYESMEKKFDKLDDSFVYTMTETDIPESVMSQESSDNLISLMYTLKTGIYYQDEETEDIISVSDISNISTDNNALSLTIKGKSLYRKTAQEMSDAYLSTATLCDMQYTLVSDKTIWKANKKRSLYSFFKKNMLLQSSDKTTMLKSSELDIFGAKYPAINAISYHCSRSCNESSMLMMTRFMESLLE